MYLQPLGLIFIYFTYYIQHCSLCRPSDYNVSESEDSGMELRTFAMFALEVMRSNTTVLSSFMTKQYGALFFHQKSLPYVN
jgi:hypothetical protein